MSVGAGQAGLPRRDERLTITSCMPPESDQIKAAENPGHWGRNPDLLLHLLHRGVLTFGQYVGWVAWNVSSGHLPQSAYEEAVTLLASA